ncbi:hypothetical protein MMC25_003328 [Agyrium rufum]|nr:hypothetical protein [Agyrium rufum]
MQIFEELETCEKARQYPFHRACQSLPALQLHIEKYPACSPCFEKAKIQASETAKERDAAASSSKETFTSFNDILRKRGLPLVTRKMYEEGKEDHDKVKQGSMSQVTDEGADDGRDGSKKSETHKKGDLAKDLW